MGQTVAHYKHPILGELQPVDYMTGKTPEDFVFQIKGESATFGLERLIELDSKNVLVWDNTELRGKFQALGKKLKITSEVSPMTFYENLKPVVVLRMTEEQLAKQQKRYVVKHRWLVVLAILLVIMSLAFNYFGFIRPRIVQRGTLSQNGNSNTAVVTPAKS